MPRSFDNQNNFVLFVIFQRLLHIKLERIHRSTLDLIVIATLLPVRHGLGFLSHDVPLPSLSGTNFHSGLEAKAPLNIQPFIPPLLPLDCKEPPKTKTKIHSLVVFAILDIK